MKLESTRRGFLRTVGAATTLTLAGCSWVPGVPGGGSDGGTATPTTGSPETSTETDNGDKQEKRGTVVEDFEENVERWGVDYGMLATTEDSRQGSQSIVLTPQGPEQRQRNFPFARISRYFGGDTSDPLDLSDSDLSITVKVNAPEPNAGIGDARITVKLFAPTDSISLLSTRTVPLEMNGWVEYDLGYTGASGDPTMDEILAMQIIIDSRRFTNYERAEFEIVIDEIRMIPKPGNGKVIFQFDDGVLSSHSIAYPILEEKGFPGSVSAIPDAIGNDTRMNRQQLLELSEVDWDIMSHPQTNRPFPQFPEDIQKQSIQRSKSTLEALGFEQGARHFVAPYSRVDRTTLDIIEQYHETGFLFGGCPANAAQPSNPYFIPRVQGSNLRGTMDIIDMAERFNQLVVIAYHRIGDGPNKIPTSSFQEIVDYVDSKDVDVITPSQLIDG